MNEELALHRTDLDADPTVQFQRWFADAVAAGVPEPEAMCLASVGDDGVPSARMVLLKGVDRRGFVFHTNFRSQKGEELLARPRAALVWRWFALERQVRVVGRAEPVGAAESDAYFATRPRGAQIGAWASPQSTVLSGRAELEGRVAEMEARFGDGSIPRPPWWGGIRVVPDTVEFWQGRRSRLHDRLRYRRREGGNDREGAPAGKDGEGAPAGKDGEGAPAGKDEWVIERLAP